MKFWNFFYLLLAVFFGGAAGYDAYQEVKREKRWVQGMDRPVYGAAGSDVFFVLVLCYLGLLNDFFGDSNKEMFFFVAKGVAVLGVYFCLLLAIRPLLRKWLRASSFVLLWSASSVAFYFMSRIARTGVDARWHVQLPFFYPGEILCQVIVIVWLLGVATIHLWSVISHLMFRRWILTDAVLMAENDVKRSCAKQAKLVHYPHGDILVYMTERAKTPLSVGLFLSSTCIVLPNRTYSQEELDLIFRHELIHICRRDSQLKLFITSLTAMMWFNPLMWLAMRRCAEDLELSCDEVVLYGYGPEVRRQYANLLLQTAGDHRGFTTCLAASPGILRSRLKEAVNPQKRVAGGVLVGILCCLLIVGSMFIEFDFRPETERIFQKSDRESWVVSDVIVTDGKKDPYTKYYDADALYDYVASLELSIHTKRVDPMREYRHVQIVFHSGNHTVIVQIGGKLVRVYQMTFHNGKRTHNEEFYYTMDEELDMEYILSCLHG